MVLKLLILLALLSACAGKDGTPEATAPGDAPWSRDSSLDPSPTDTSFLPEYGAPLRFEHITVEDGLSHSTVTAILQDRYGYLWFGTDDGLNKYNAYGFTTYRHDPERADSLSDNHILTLFEDSQGILWVGTAGGGLNRFDRETDSFQHWIHDPNDDRSLGDETNRIHSIDEDREGLLWIGTRTGLESFEPETESFVHYRTVIDTLFGEEANPVYDIHEAEDGRIWIGTLSGLHSWDRQSVRFKHYWPQPQALNEIHNQVQVIVPDQEGNLWLGTGGSGLYRFDITTKRFTQYLINPDDIDGYSYNDVKDILLDPQGLLWLTTDGGGLYQFDVETETFRQYRSDPKNTASLSSDYLREIYLDNSGVIWIGTWASGINKLDTSLGQFVHYQHDPNDTSSLAHNRVLSIAEDRSGQIWIGTDGGGLDRFEPRTGVFTHVRSDPGRSGALPSNYISVVYVDRDGEIWVATWGNGLSLLDQKTGEFTNWRHDLRYHWTLSSDFITVILEDSKGQLWIGTSGGGLNQFDRQANEFLRYTHDPLHDSTLSSNVILSLLEDRNGFLWVGTSAGLSKFDPGSKAFQRYPSPADPHSGSPSGSVIALREGRDGSLWLGTDQGLCLFNRDVGECRFYTVEDGMPDNTVYAILEDNLGRLWISTANGLARFNPAEEEFELYGVGDGLQAYEFTYGAALKSATGEMYFGGINGFNQFMPERVQKNLSAPAVVLTSITQGTQELDLAQSLDTADQIHLDWPNNYFEFEFAALNYRQPDRNQFAYKLEGFDTDWNFTGTRRFGRYTNLPGGDYTLRVIGANNDGIWNEEGLSLAVRVRPPVWQTAWFRGLMIGLLIMGILAGYRLRIRNYETRSRQLELQVNERTHEIEQQRQTIETLYQADEDLLTHVRLQAVQQTLADIAVTRLHADRSAVFTWDDTNERLIAHATCGYSPAMNQVGSTATEPCEIIEVMTTGRPRFVSDMHARDRISVAGSEIMRQMKVEGVQSYMHLPIRLEKEIYGVFHIGYTSTNAFEEKDIKLFAAVAQRAAVIMQNARLFESERRRADQFRVISEVGSQITSILAVDHLLREIARSVREVFSYYVVGIGLIEGDELVIRASAGVDASLIEREPYRVKVGQEGIMGKVAGTGQAVIVADVTQDSSYLAWPSTAQTRSEVAVPLKSKSGIIGVLNVESDTINAFDESDIILLQSIADQAAVAIENAHLYDQAQKLAVVEERNRLARDLHDAVTQTLFSASVLAEVLPETYEMDREEGRQLLRELQQLNRGALAEMRTLLLELRPAVLVEADLRDLLRQLSDAVSGRSGLEMVLHLHGDCDLGDDVHVALYRIAQEALNNVVKHARATRAEVSLQCHTLSASNGEKLQRVRLSIRDDGRGFDPDDIPADHLGIRIIRERARAISADLTIESEPGKGTIIQVLWQG